MKVTAVTRRALAARREERDLARQGYRRHETDWTILRGHQMGQIIVDAKVSADGLYVWTKIGPPPSKP